MPEKYQNKYRIKSARLQNQGKNSVLSIINSYKSAVSKDANKLGFGFNWQTRFYNHIIRNEELSEKISEYIIYNSAIWTDDKFYQKS